MIVVSDTSPLNYLILVGEAHVLEALFGRILLPPAVARELGSSAAPEAVRSWFERRPAWVEITAPRSIDPTVQLGEGETEAISLAAELKAKALLMDDHAARKAAVARGLVVVGTLAVLAAAAEQKLLDLRAVLTRLGSTSFRATPKLIQAILSNQGNK